MKPLILAIAGASGSGKTTIANTLIKKLPEINGEIGRRLSGLVLKLRDFYFPRDNVSLKERGELNYDIPLAFDYNLLSDVLEKLSSYESTEKPVWDFINYTRQNEREKVGPADLIVVEGILTLYQPQTSESRNSILDLADYKIFVDTRIDICAVRKIGVDVEERGKTLRESTKQWENTVRPSYDQFILPTKERADFIVSWTGNTEKAVEGIIRIMRDYFKKQV